jgi:hypothetical protein
MHFLFLDESGEFGFEDGSSTHLLIAILETDNAKHLKNVMRKEKKRLHDLGWPPAIEIKGTHLYGCHRMAGMPAEIVESRHDHAARIITKIAGCGVRPHYSIVRKGALKPHLRNAPYGIAYNYFAGNVICKLHNGRLNCPVTLVVDRRNKETHAHMPFDGYVTTRVISDCSHEHEFTIRHEDSRDWLGLQAVDFISWGLFRHYEHGDSRYRDLIRPTVGIRDSWYA